MDFPLFLALTASEFAVCQDFPPQMAYMACHYSSSNAGISGVPSRLPAGSALMFTDRMTPGDHDPDRIAGELSDAVRHLECRALFLDLQRPDLPLNNAVTEAVLRSVPCPVIVSELYARSRDCAVLLPPPLLWTALEKHLEPWGSRPIWLEAAIEGAEVTVTKNGSDYAHCPFDPLDHGFHYQKLHIDYQVTLQKDHAVFHLRRDRRCMEELLQEASAHGVRGALGLYQQLA